MPVFNVILVVQLHLLRVSEPHCKWEKNWPNKLFSWKQLSKSEWTRSIISCPVKRCFDFAVGCNYLHLHKNKSSKFDLHSIFRVCALVNIFTKSPSVSHRIHSKCTKSVIEIIQQEVDNNNFKLLLDTNCAHYTVKWRRPCMQEWNILEKGKKQ